MSASPTPAGARSPAQRVGEVYHIKLGDYDRAIELGWDKDTGVVGDDFTADPELEMPKAA